MVKEGQKIAFRVPDGVDYLHEVEGAGIMNSMQQRLPRNRRRFEGTVESVHGSEAHVVIDVAGQQKKVKALLSWILAN